MNAKKIAGLIAWLIAFTLPFQYSLLNTDEVVRDDGSADNILGLISFVAMLALVFIGYWLVDSASGKGSEAHGH